MESSDERPTMRLVGMCLALPGWEGWGTGSQRAGFLSHSSGPNSIAALGFDSWYALSAGADHDPSTAADFPAWMPCANHARTRALSPRAEHAGTDPSAVE